STPGFTSFPYTTLFRSSWPSLSLRLALRALAQPRLAVDLLRLAWSFRARGWYRSPPFLPLPPREYIRWRMFTAYGDEAAVPPLRSEEHTSELQSRFDLV